MLQDLYSDDLIGEPRTLEEEIEEEIIEEEIEGPLYLDNEVEEEAAETEEGANEDDTQNLQTPGTRVQPKKRVKKPQLKLDPERLKGPRGISLLEGVFKDFKFYGVGHEKEDLDRVMKQLEHWAHRLFPKFKFDDFLEKLETLGQKQPVMVYVKKIRMGLETAESAQVTGDHIEDIQDEDQIPLDPFDDLISHQLPEQIIPQTGHSSRISASEENTMVTSEQRERMERNRQKAREKMLARVNAQSKTSSEEDSFVVTSDNLDNSHSLSPKEHTETFFVEGVTEECTNDQSNTFLDIQTQINDSTNRNVTVDNSQSENETSGETKF